MKWFTTSGPLEDGWYWLRDKGSAASGIPCDVDDGTYLEWGEHREARRLSNFEAFEWAGPIPEPEESENE